MGESAALLLLRGMCFAAGSKINLQFNKNVLFIFGSDSDNNIPLYYAQGRRCTALTCCVL